MAYNTILYERSGNHLHKITLNRPTCLNAMTGELRFVNRWYTTIVGEYGRILVP